MTNVIIIPARSGSQRLKNKNLLKINQKTLVERTLIFSKKIKFIDKIIVSSNNHKILNYKDKYKNVYFIERPKNYSLNKSILIPNNIKQNFLELENESDRIIFIDNFLDSIIENSKNKKNKLFKGNLFN